MKKVAEGEDKIKMLVNNDGGFYASVAILEEEKAKMKEELRALKIKQKSLEETNNSLNQILEGLKLNLKVSHLLRSVCILIDCFVNSHLECSG